MSILEKCRGCYIQASMKVGTEDESLLEMSSFQRVLCTGFNGIGTGKYVIIIHG